MQATIHSTPASTLLTIADASERFGVHPWTLREWDRKGLIRSYRVGETGWRRFDPQSIAEHMGLASEAEQGSNGPLPCIYARVSSESQDKAGNLKRQIDRMKKEVAAREGCSPRSVQVFSDTASSYGDRPGLNALVEKVIDGKVNILSIFRRFNHLPCFKVVSGRALQTPLTQLSFQSLIKR